MRLLTQAEAAEMLRVSDGTIENYRKQGLPFIKMSSGKEARKNMSDSAFRKWSKIKKETRGCSC